MPEDNATSHQEAFAYSRTFPDAASIFSYVTPQLSAVRDSCIVVLDTNVLLFPYSVSQKTLATVATAYTALSNTGRLLIPAQVAREFAKHRPQKLADLHKQLLDHRSRINSVAGQYPPLLASLPEHSSLLALEGAINDKIVEYHKVLDKVVTTVRDWNWNDPVSALYSRLFLPETIIECPDEVGALRADLEDRARNRIPPGYKDSGKQINAAGDLIIWRTILHLAALHKRPVLFVSLEEKSDWWHMSAGTALYPRYELIDEFRRASGGSPFFLSSLSTFLEVFGASASAIQEVRQEETTQRATTTTSRALKSRYNDLPLASYEHPARAFAQWYGQKTTAYAVSTDPLPGIPFEFEYPESWPTYAVVLHTSGARLSHLRKSYAFAIQPLLERMQQGECRCAVAILTHTHGATRLAFEHLSKTCDPRLQHFFGTHGYDGLEINYELKPHA